MHCKAMALIAFELEEAIFLLKAQDLGLKSKKRAILKVRVAAARAAATEHRKACPICAIRKS